MKTKKFFIQFENFEVELSTMIEISEKEYKKQFNFLLSQKLTAEKEDYDFKITHRTYNEEYAGYTQQRDYFTCACGDTILYKQICKEGYHFKTKKEKRREKNV